MHILEKIISNFKNNKSLYIGEKLTMSEHMIQSAMLAEKAKCNDNLICSCLLHDYGHFLIENPDSLVMNDKDGKHESIGYEYLKKFFKKEIVEPIKYHVLAKRYLCRNKLYYDHLSQASKVSLKLQGGVMNDEEEKKFTSLKFYQDAIKVREYDDSGKIPNIKIKSIDDYQELISSQLIK